jgi:hypothetical protein
MKRRDASVALVLGAFSLAGKAQAPARKLRHIGYLNNRRNSSW